MARDWRKVAFAMIAALAFAGVFAPAVESQTASRMAKAKAKAKEAAGPAAPADEAKAASKKKQDPVEAQRTIDAAAKLIQAGKIDQATQSLTAVLNAGNLPPPIMAKALYTRGAAFRQKSQPAQAISDLTSALWLKGGLNEADRADALKQRSQAYADAGLSEAGTSSVASAIPEAKERPGPPAKGWSTETAAPAQSASGGNWFENLFGASAAPAPPPAPKAASPPPETASISKADPPSTGEKLATRPRVSKAWSSSTEVHAAAPERPRPAAPAAVSEPKASPAPVAAVAAKIEGKYRVQLATVRTQAEAQALATKAKREHAVLASSQPQIDQTVFGNMGSFYRVRFGPYTTLQETQAVCARLKGSGFDCMSVTQ